MIRKIHLLTLLIGVGAISTALVAQYVFELEPCILCIYQRIPYAFLIVFSLLFLFSGKDRRRISAIIYLLIFLIGTGIAGFHVGVEEAWWQGTENCGSKQDASNVDELINQIMSTKVKKCSEPEWKMFGISMAGYNFIFSLFFSIFFIFYFVKSNRRVKKP